MPNAADEPVFRGRAGSPLSSLMDWSLRGLFGWAFGRGMPRALAVARVMGRVLLLLLLIPWRVLVRFLCFLITA